MTLPLFDRPELVAVRAPELRPYQKRAIDKLRQRWAEGKRRMLLVAPCAAGKMCVAAHMIKASTQSAMFVAHRMELIEQCANELAKLGITNIGILRGDDDRCDPSATTQVASIQTLARRKKPPAKLIIIDEAHRASSDSYVEHVFDHYTDSIIIGLTATPTRLDGRPLGGKLFETLDVMVRYDELYALGFTAKPECYSAPEPLPELAAVPRTTQDFAEKPLAKIMNTRALVGSLVDHWLRRAHLHPAGQGKHVEGPRRSTMVFACDIAHSKAIEARFRQSFVRVAHLDGETPENERKSILAALAGGELEVVTNCNILLEGVDIPRVKCAVHARPTLSLVLWVQSTMRIGRYWCPKCDTGPPVCPRGPGHASVVPLLLDHASNWDRHGAPFEDLAWSLNDRAIRQTAERSKLCKQCYAYVDPQRYTCPHCGFVFPDPPVRKAPTESPEELIRRATEPEALKRAFYDKTVEEARGAGFRPGYAAAKFKERYGAWPPRAWGYVTTAAWASDPLWQDRIARRIARREANQIAAQRPEMAVGDDPAGLAGDLEDEEQVLDLGDESLRQEYEAEAPFADWVDQELGR